MEDREIIGALVSHLRENGYPDLEVDKWPDDENRRTPDIDAVAGPFAIEHTSIDTLPNQRRNDHWFMEVVGDFQEEFKDKLNFHLDVRVDYYSVTKGQNWPEIKQAIREWITNSAPNLADGHHVLDNVPGVPFPMHIEKSVNRKPGVFFGRFLPEDDSLPDRFKKQIDNKASKLIKYQRLGKTTILLIEGQDILMDRSRIPNAIKNAYPDGLPSAIEQMWYVENAETYDPASKPEFKDLTPSICKKASSEPE